MKNYPIIVLSMKKILLSSLLISSFLTLSSCGDKKGGRNDLSETEEVEKDSTKGLVVTLEGVFTKNDHFQLFYSNDTNFLEENSITIPVYGQCVVQDIAFELPEGKKPQNLRLDLGSNAEQQFISIKNISIEYRNKIIFNGENEKYLDYFPESSTVVYNPQKLNFELKNNLEGIFDPIMFSNDNLKKVLNKVYNETK